MSWEKLLAAIVDHNSGTENTEGCENVRKTLIPEFEKLGFRATTNEVGSGHKVLSFNSSEKPRLLFMGHLDTVFPKGTTFTKFSVDGDKLRGPGVIDMKGGVVLMLEVLKKLGPSPIRIVLNDDEEVGSPFSCSTIKKLAADVPYGLVFEPGLNDGTLVTAHSGVRWFELKVRGKAAHAGLEHHLGVNAAVELSHKITKLAALTDYERKLTVNTGTISGGTTANTVCQHASAKIDVRYVDEADLEGLVDELKTITETTTVPNAKAELSVISRMPSMPPSSSEKLFRIAKAAAEGIGQNIKGTWVGYASDANHLAETGMQLLVGTGPYGGNMHTHDEFMSRSSFEERLRLNEAIVRGLLQ